MTMEQLLPLLCLISALIVFLPVYLIVGDKVEKDKDFTFDK